MASAAAAGIEAYATHTCQAFAPLQEWDTDDFDEVLGDLFGDIANEACRKGHLSSSIDESAGPDRLILATADLTAAFEGRHQTRKLTTATSHAPVLAPDPGEAPPVIDAGPVRSNWANA